MCRILKNIHSGYLKAMFRTLFQNVNDPNKFQKFLWNYALTIVLKVKYQKNKATECRDINIAVSISDVQKNCF